MRLMLVSLESWNIGKEQGTVNGTLEAASLGNNDLDWQNKYHEKERYFVTRTGIMLVKFKFFKKKVSNLE